MANNSLPEKDEALRLATLREYRVLDSFPEESFDNLAMITAQLCNAPIALVSLIDKKRQWFKSKIGLAVSETPRDISFCAHAIESGKPLVVENALKDPRFSNNPLVTEDPYIRFYAGEPIRAYNGQYLGTLCVIDNVPRKFKKEERKALAIFAREIEKHLELRRLKYQKEELISMFVHDFNNPLTVILGTTDLLLTTGDMNHFNKNCLSRILLESSRVSRMTSDLLDILKSEDSHLLNNPVATDLTLFFQVFIEAAEFNTSIHRHNIQTSINVPTTLFKLDTSILRRILDNLIDNAIKYSPEKTSIALKAEVENDHLIISVSDHGSGIPKQEQEKVFEPFFRLEHDASRKGAGIGLAFCKLGVNCMGGTISLENNSDNEGTTFLIKVPLASG